jgi:hypothetical protein
VHRRDTEWSPGARGPSRKLSWQKDHEELSKVNWRRQVSGSAVLTGCTRHASPTMHTQRNAKGEHKGPLRHLRHFPHQQAVGRCNTWGVGASCHPPNEKSANELKAVPTGPDCIKTVPGGGARSNQVNTVGLADGHQVDRTDRRPSVCWVPMLTLDTWANNV